MKAPFLVMVCASLVLAAESSKEDPTKRDREKLQGVWTLVASEADGDKGFFQAGGKFSVEIKGDKYTLKVMGKEKSSTEGTFKLDPSGKRKTFDFKYEELGRKTPVEGIYELDGDNLKLCFQIVEGRPRPKGFSAKKGSGQALMIWKREKH